MYKYLLAFFAILPLASCNDNVKANPKDVVVFYNTIQESFNKYADPQHLLMEKASDAVNKIQADNNAIIDTKELRAILAEAKKASAARMAIVVAVKEVDATIDYKNKVINSINILNKAYDKEFKEYIDLLDVKTENKLDKLTQIMQPALYEIETAAKDCEVAGNNLATKYDFKKQ